VNSSENALPLRCSTASQKARSMVDGFMALSPHSRHAPRRRGIQYSRDSDFDR
jgi:hypothetical protein